MGSLAAQAPQKTPTSDAPFKRARFKGIFGIGPEAKPITRNLPFQATALNACSEKSPPTGS